MTESSLRTSTSIPPDVGWYWVAGDDWIVDAWRMGQMNPQGDIIIRATRGDGERDYHFELNRGQAGELVNLLQNLIAIPLHTDDE
jgi:hypothetical protein